MSKQSDLISVSQGAAGDPLFVDAANNRVGVGTASPDLLLTLQSTGDAQVSFKDTVGTTRAYLGTGGAFGTAPTGALRVRSDQGGIVFGISGTETARIDASGNLLVGTTSPIYGYVGNIQTFASNGYNFLASGNSSSALCFALRNVNNQTGTIVGTITYGASSTAYNTTSDYRLKENVASLTGAADRLAQIPVHRFNFIADPDTTVDGFLAHEVQAFVPEAVTGEKDAVDKDGKPVHQGIDQSKLVPLLTAALQEAPQKIDALETRISALETN